ncbi:MAG: radical SAM protein, partial [Desulfovibrio sp.]|nr:radical SAM protein [Desulfovibrio sp.]
MDTRLNLLNCTRKELSDYVQQELGQPRFRADQIFQWLWQKLVNDIDAMSNIAKQTRSILAERCRISWPTILETQVSTDQTTKFLLQLEDGALIETVLLPSKDHQGKLRWAQCLSSQVGCAMECTFCATGQVGFQRNLTMAEILGQVLIGRAYLGDHKPDHPILRNLVFMGMGEPLANLKELMRSLETLNDPKGLAFSPRRITVSTCGLKHGMEAFGRQGLAYL